MGQIKKLFFVLMILSVVSLCLSSDIKNGTEWELIWSDEFDYTGHPSPYKWSFDLSSNALHGEDKEDQFYSNYLLENARVENGVLTISALEKEQGGRNYTSAKINTKGKFSTTYGRFEARMKLPSGRGIWPTFSLDSENNPFGTWPGSGHIRVVDFFGWFPNQIRSTVHTEAFNYKKNNAKSKSLRSSSIHDDFHIYAVEWFPDKMTFYYDDKKVLTVKGAKNDTAKWPFTHPFYISLNSAVGGKWCELNGGIGNTVFPQDMIIDYVRVYKAKSDKPLTVSVRALGGGSVRVSPQKESYSFGEMVTLTALPDEGKQLVKWSPPPSQSKVSGNSVTFPIYNNESLDVHFQTPGEMLLNGDFGALRFLGWSSWVKNPAIATRKIDKETLLMSINKLTKEPWEVQASYADITMMYGSVYKLSFDAKASKKRTLFAGITKNYDPYHSYIWENFSLSREWKSYSKTFTFKDPNDIRCRLEFDYGGDTGKVWIDNVSLVRLK